MEQNVPTYEDVLEREDVLKALHLENNDLIESLPIEIVSTGLRDIMVPIKSLARLHAINPDFNRIKDVSKKYNVIGIHAFAIDGMNETAECRNFAPLYGIDEESATGTSNGALSCYLYKYKKISREHIKNIKIKQGVQMGRPSEIYVKLAAKGSRIHRVQVGGYAVIVDEITYSLSSRMP